MAARRNVVVVHCEREVVGFAFLQCLVIRVLEVERTRPHHRPGTIPWSERDLAKGSAADSSSKPNTPCTTAANHPRFDLTCTAHRAAMDACRRAPTQLPLMIGSPPYQR